MSFPKTQHPNKTQSNEWIQKNNIFEYCVGSTNEITVPHSEWQDSYPFHLTS